MFFYSAKENDNKEVLWPLEEHLSWDACPLGSKSNQWSIYSKGHESIQLRSFSVFNDQQATGSPHTAGWIAKQITNKKLHKCGFIDFTSEQAPSCLYPINGYLNEYLIYFYKNQDLFSPLIGMYIYFLFL